MSLLTPLYLAGLALVSLPILFHFLRRAPRGTQVFSSLMFLSPSPPRLTRRSKLDHLLLLLLRGLALVLLALAFCRPFQRQSSALAWPSARGKRVAILIDTSASMRRGSLWSDAQRQASQALDDLGSNDIVALFAFDDRLSTIVDFPAAGAPLTGQAAAIRQQIKGLRPSWDATQLGSALAMVCEQLQTLDERHASEQTLQIVLISDLQEGSRLAALQGAAWPESVSVDVRRVTDPQPNASLHLLSDPRDAADPLAARVRVINDPKAVSDKLRLSWRRGDRLEPDPAPVTVPPGESRVVRTRRPVTMTDATVLELSGDSHTFDNVCYVAPPVSRRIQILFWGDEDADDAQGLRFYMEAAVQSAPQHQLQSAGIAAADGPPAPERLAEADLVVITRNLNADESAAARRAAEQGARLLVVVRDAQAVGMLEALLPGCQVTVEEVGGGFAMWSDIDFDHLAFAPLDSPRYNDFTKVRFWKHRNVKIDPAPEDLQVVARFDNQDIAWAQWPLEHGQVTMLASGWQPGDSQLAVSSKFVPLVTGLLQVGERARRRIEVGQAVPRSVLAEDVAGVTVVTPAGDEISLPDDAEAFTETDRPGMYLARWPGGERPLAVNLAADESLTAPLEESALAQHGVRLGQATSLGQVERQRQRQRAELEREQKLWQWLIAAAVVVLLLETALAARYARATDQLQAA